MAMGPERLKPLHNFTLPFLKWGNQRYLRCMKLDSDGGGGSGGEVSYSDRRSSSPAVKLNSPVRFYKDPVKRVRGSQSKIEGDEGIEAVREKLMIDLKTAAHQMKVAFLRDDDDDVEDDVDIDVAITVKELTTAETVEEFRPWSLRTRRTVTVTAASASAAASKSPIGLKKSRSDGGVRSPRRRPEKREREKFSVSLSKKEIEEDFLAMMDRRPPRRPKKRPRIVQRQMDMVFPGLWLTEITADIYEVPEIPENGKR